MSNRWNIPAWLEAEVRERDRSCVYCRAPFNSSTLPRSAPSWEHIINDASIITRQNIALCCRGCNASKGQKSLAVWLETTYCKVRGITRETVAPSVQKALSR